MKALLVLCMCPSQEVAKQLAQIMVEAKLAACVNVLPGVLSIFSWKEKIETEEEVQLIIKTTVETYPELEKALLKHHPYECPEVIGIPIEFGYRGYLQWINETLSPLN